MFRMAVGHSDDIDVDQAIGTVLGECRRGLQGDQPSAGLLFAAFEMDHRALVSAVREEFPGIELTGSTSAGEMSSVLGFQEDSVTLAVFSSDRVDITSGLGTGVAADPAGAARKAVEEARSKTDRDPRLCIVMPPAARVNPHLLEALRAALGPGVPILGGAAAARSNREALSGSYQFAGDVVTDDGVPVLLFSGDLSFSFGVDTGWRPIGPRVRVTRASPAGVEEIGDQPALEFYERYLGAGIEPAFANPLAVFEDESDRFYLRAPTSHDRVSGAVMFAGGVPEGATVQLTVAATDEIFGGTKAALSKALEGFPQGAKPDAALVFSCAIRKFLLGTRTGTEIEMARQLFGQDIPIAGFYCYGEIAPVESADATRYHNETIVAVLMGAP